MRSMSQATRNALLTTTAVVAASYAVALLVAPGPTAEAFGVATDYTSIWFLRLLGVASLSFAALAFFGRRLEDIAARRALDGGFLVGFAGSLGITMWAQYLQVMNPLGWLHVAVYGAFAVAYFYFLAAEDRLGTDHRGRPA